MGAVSCFLAKDSMILLDKEPRAITTITTASPEGLSSSIISPQVPDVFNKAFSGEPIGFLDSAIKLPVLRGRDRFISITTPDSSKKDLLIRLQYRRSGRGPCPGCHAGTPEGHHWGSKCTRRGVSTFSSRFSSKVERNTLRIGFIFLN